MSTEGVFQNVQRSPTSIKHDLLNSPKEVSVIVGTHTGRSVSGYHMVLLVPTRHRHPTKVPVIEGLREGVVGTYRTTGTTEWVGYVTNNDRYLFGLSPLGEFDAGWSHSEVLKDTLGTHFRTPPDIKTAVRSSQRPSGPTGPWEPRSGKHIRLTTTDTSFH